jgi:hypothetical protein
MLKNLDDKVEKSLQHEEDIIVDRELMRNSDFEKGESEFVQRLTNTEGEN